MPYKSTEEVNEEFERRFEFGNENPALLGKGDALSYIHSLRKQDIDAFQEIVRKCGADPETTSNDTRRGYVQACVDIEEALIELAELNK